MDLGTETLNMKNSLYSVELFRELNPSLMFKTTSTIEILNLFFVLVNVTLAVLKSAQFGIDKHKSWKMNSRSVDCFFIKSSGTSRVQLTARICVRN